MGSFLPAAPRPDADRMMPANSGGMGTSLGFLEGGIFGKFLWICSSRLLFFLPISAPLKEQQTAVQC